MRLERPSILSLLAVSEPLVPAKTGESGGGPGSDGSGEGRSAAVLV